MASSPKHPGGRPSKYSEAYCNEAISFMGLGYSLTAFAGEIGVSRETIYEWERSIPEFSDAIKIARAKRVLALEQKMLTAETNQQLTASIFGLKNACPPEWRDKVEIDHNTTVTHVHRVDEEALADMDTEDLAAMSDMLARLVSKGEKPKSVN